MEIKLEAWLKMREMKKYSLIVLFLLIILVVVVSYWAQNSPEPRIKAKDVKFAGEVYSKSLEVLDDTGYTIHLLLCPLIDEEVVINITPKEWIDQRAITYVLLPPDSYPPEFLEDIPEEIGKFQVVAVAHANLRYENGTIIYKGQVEKDKCIVLSPLGEYSGNWASHAGSRSTA